VGTQAPCEVNGIYSRGSGCGGWCDFHRTHSNPVWIPQSHTATPVAMLLSGVHRTRRRQLLSAATPAPSTQQTQKNKKRPCNSWVFCYSYPQCWSLDTGNWHGFGECWLKWQVDPKHPLYGQRGKFTAEFRRKHWNAHKTGRNPDGTPRNLTVPTHVPWTGGVMGTVVDRSINWETGLDGMKSSAGESTVLWRAWESREQNLARGVRPESMGSAWGAK